MAGRSSNSSSSRSWLRTTGDGGWSWLVVAGAFVIQILGGGTHYAQGVYVSLFLEEFKESKSMTALIGSIFGACLMMSAPLSAKCAEKFGNRRTAFGATLLASAGLILSAFANTIVMLYLTFSVMTGLGLGLSYMPGIKAVGEHFQRKRAIAMGIACAGVGMGSFLFPPIVNSLLQGLGLKGTLITHGVITFISLGLSSVALIPCEKTTGQRHLVEDAEKGTSAATPMIASQEGESQSLWHDPRFLLLCANQMFGWLACIIVIMDLAPYGKTELELEAHHASMLLSTSGALNVLGRIVGGFVIVACRRFFSPLTYYTSLNVMLVVSTFCIPIVSDYIGMLVLSGFFGWGLSCYSAVLADMVAEMFGQEAIAFSFGYFVMFQGIGALVGAPLSGMLHDELGTYKYSFALAGVFFIVAVILVVIVRIMNITMSSKRSSTTTTPAKPLLSAKTITSIIATSVNNLTRVASSANRLSSQQQLQQQDDEVAVVVRTLTQAKDVSSSSSTDFAGLQPVWIAGGDDEGIQLPRLELIQVHAENDANSLHQMELTETTSITDGASVTLKPNPSDAAHHLPNSQGPSRLSFVESNHEEPLTAQEVYAEIAAEGVPILEPEKAPIPLEEEEEDEEELALGPDEIEQLLEPEEFPGSCTITPMPASPMPMSSYPGSHRDSWVPGDETSRTPVPEVVICDPWTATPPVLSLSPPSNSLGMDLSPAWTLRHDDLNTALQGHHQREEEAWEPEQAPLLAEAKIKDSSSSELADLEIADSNSQWPSSASDDCTLSYIPLQSIDDPISESSDDSNFLESNQSTIQSCISEADMDLRSLRRLGIDVKQHTNNSSNNN